MKDKMQARQDFIEMIKHSWTYNRMTKQEKDCCIHILRECELLGTYKQRWIILHSAYYSYLVGIGYPRRDEPCRDWRPEDKEELELAF